LLEDEKRLARATPALRIALDLRAASCTERLALLDRAASEGDARTLIVLETLGLACYPQNKDIHRTLFELRTRLAKQ
jgi:serine/threonine-protein kinase